MLRVDLEDFEGNTRFAQYNIFGVMNEDNMYKLNLGVYSGMIFFLLLFIILYFLLFASVNTLKEL